MRALLQRVRHAHVDIDGERVGSIGHGLLVLLGVAHDDDESAAIKLAERTLAYRIFADDQGKMNRNLIESGGALLVVSQFTLCADTSKGLRPGFSTAAPPERAEALYNSYVKECLRIAGEVATGRFGANMQVSLCNDGPVTIMLESSTHLT